MQPGVTFTQQRDVVLSRYLLDGHRMQLFS